MFAAVETSQLDSEDEARDEEEEAPANAEPKPVLHASNVYCHCMCIVNIFVCAGACVYVCMH